MRRGDSADPQKERERRMKVSKIRRGENHPMFGKHPSEETRRKMREAKKGTINPMLGRHHSEETRRKMSEAKKGENHPRFGKHHSEETRQKMREAHKGLNRSEEKVRELQAAKQLQVMQRFHQKLAEAYYGKGQGERLLPYESHRLHKKPL
ncbi:MAG: NUMOD3 domain-containing DNA-binding protein [Methanoregula sp.]|jgi:hypothetical protein